MENLQHTPLTATHQALGAKMAEFAGYSIPILYVGITEEHHHTRNAASLFDISHMGQIVLEGDDLADMLTLISPSDCSGMVPGEGLYTVLLNPQGGIVDDVILTALDDTSVLLTVNAANRAKVMAYLNTVITQQGFAAELNMLKRAIVALQGPKALDVMNRFVPAAPWEELPFMHTLLIELGGAPILVSRSGYTGEDGFELSMSPDIASDIWQSLIADADVRPCGLGARDTLRLEAGLPLYGHDIDDSTSPIEASLSWIMRKDISACMGAERLLAEQQSGPSRKRIGVEIMDKGIARAETPLFNEQGTQVGQLTSGGFAPTFGKAIGQAYVNIAYATANTPLWAEVRGKKLAARTCPLRFFKRQPDLEKEV